MSEQDCRAAFEKWFSEDGKYPKATEKNAKGEYILASAYSSWVAWLAAWRTVKESLTVGVVKDSLTTDATGGAA